MSISHALILKGTFEEIKGEKITVLNTNQINPQKLESEQERVRNKRLDGASEGKRSSSNV